MRVRLWDAPIAVCRAYSSLLGCTDMVLIATVEAIRSKLWKRSLDCKLEGLLQYGFFARSLSVITPAPHTSRSTVAVMHRSWVMSVEVVDERDLEMAAVAPTGKAKAAVLLLVRHGHVVLVQVGGAERVGAAVGWFLVRA